MMVMTARRILKWNLIATFYVATFLCCMEKYFYTQQIFQRRRFYDTFTACSLKKKILMYFGENLISFE
jgi:hypothetical protein